MLLGANPAGGSPWRQGGGPAGSPLRTLGGIAGGGNQPQMPVSDLQRQTSSYLQQFLSQPAPEQRALDLSMPQLQDLIAGRGTGDIIGGTRGYFNQNLQDQLSQMRASAPGRWSSGVLESGMRLRERSMNDFNLLVSQIMQNQADRSLGAMGMLGQLSGQAGQAPFNRLATAGSLGTAQTGQNIDWSRLQSGNQLQALQMLLGPMLSGAFGGSILTQPSGLQQGMQAGGSLAQLLMLMQLMGRGSGSDPKGY